MAMWRPQHYLLSGRSSEVSESVLKNAVAVANEITDVNPKLPPVFSLGHISHILGVEYGFLRAVVARDNADPYKVFRVRKSSVPERGFRIICVPDPALMATQRWIARKIISHGRTHPASFAYAKGCKIFDAAEQHCRCQWMIKLDVRRFFESISEIAVYRVFRGLGYQPLLSFELARLCTRMGSPTYYRQRYRWRSNSFRYEVIGRYRNGRMGHLPQGAPTSPMLSNLCMVGFDENVSAIADRHDLVYSRYADDICLSTQKKKFSRNEARKVIGAVYREMSRHGLTPNVTKTHIVPPGARKTVLGLFVDGSKPRLSREFRGKLRQHLYYLTHKNIGPAKHAANRGFASVLGLRYHIEGLVAFAQGVDPHFAEGYRQRLAGINWPL